MTRSRVLVLGATGMLGFQVFSRASRDPRFEAIGAVRTVQATALIPDRLRASVVVGDISDPQALDAIFQKAAPDLVVNCAGLTKARAKAPLEAIAVNALAPHRIACVCAASGARLVHISTDCVFSGAKGDYTETDLPDPPDLYGRSKLLGEVIDPPHLTVRTSFIGRELRTAHGLLEWFLAQEGTVKGFTHAYWSGWTAPVLANLLIELALRRDVCGLIHVGSGKIDKFALLRLLRDAYHKADVTIEPVHEPVIDRSFDSARFASLGIPYPDLDRQIRDLPDDPHYKEWTGTGQKGLE